MDEGEYRRLLESPVAPHPSSLKEIDRCWLRMLVASLADRAVDPTATLAEEGARTAPPTPRNLRPLEQPADGSFLVPEDPRDLMRAIPART